MATVSCPAARFLAHGLLAHTALLVYATHGIYSAARLSCPFQRGVRSSGSLVCLLVSKQTGSDKSSPETVALGSDVYILPTLTTT